jgi:hypothetical protein
MTQPATFLTRHTDGTIRAYNDKGRRVPLAEAAEGLPVIDIRPYPDGCMTTHAPTGRK